MKTVKVTIPDEAFWIAASMAEKRGLATGNNSGVPAIMKMSLSAYLSKYSTEIARETPTTAGNSTGGRNLGE